MVSMQQISSSFLTTNQIQSSNILANNQPSSDGITWPYDTSSDARMPNPADFIIDWNAPDATMQAEQAYTTLVNWVMNNPGCYNGYIMLLQFTVDLTPYAADNSELANFLQIQTPIAASNQSLIQMIAEYAMYVSGFNNGDNGESFLNQVSDFLTGQPSLDLQIIDAMFTALGSPKVFATTLNSNNVWAYLASDTSGPQYFLNFSDLIGIVTSNLGNSILADNSSAIQSTINSYYQQEISILVQQAQDNPWLLMILLMNLINQRNTDNSNQVNGYSNNLEVIGTMNTYISQMLQDISSATPSGAQFNDFFQQLKQVQAIVSANPSLGSDSLISQLQSTVQTLMNQRVTFTYNTPTTENPSGWTPANPNTVSWDALPDIITLSGTISTNCMIKDGNGTPLYENQGDNTLTSCVNGATGLHFATSVEAGQSCSITVGDLLSLGGGAVLADVFAQFNPTYTPPVSSGGKDPTYSNTSNQAYTTINTLEQPFQNATSSIQSLLNSPSSSIQQQIQYTTQLIEQMQNFEKEAFDSLVGTIQQAVKNTSQSMG